MSYLSKPASIIMLIFGFSTTLTYADEAEILIGGKVNHSIDISTDLTKEDILKIIPMPLLETDAYENEPEINLDDVKDLLQTIPSDSKQTSDEHLVMLPPQGLPTEVRNTDIFPYSTSGKLIGFNRIFPPELTSCSGAFVYQLNIVITAAHCIMDNHGNLFDSVYFYREFGSGLLNYKQSVKIEEAYAPIEYIQQTSNTARVPYDIAIACTSTASPIGLPLDLGHKTLNKPALVLGYPKNFENGEKMMQVVTGPTKLVNVITDQNNSNLFFGVVESTFNPFGHGASGGPWIGPPYGRSIGLSSAAPKNKPNVVHSPYFGSGFANVLEKVLLKCG